MRKRGCILVLLMLASCWGTATGQNKPQPGCAASTLTDDEARILLYVTPAAITARTAGTDVDIEQSGPMAGLPGKDFFVAALVTQEPTADSLFGNGILGYFAVDKRTGEVEALSDFKPVKGKELMRVQDWMRHSHGIKVHDTSSSRSEAPRKPEGE